MEHSNSFPDSFHRVTIKGLCVRDGRVLLVHEAPSLSGKWELPGGGLDFGEDIKVGFRREVKEEMGLKVLKISKSPIYVWTYKHKANKKRNLDWYYALIVAYRIEFENLNFVPSAECETIQFFSRGELQRVKFNGQIEELARIFDPKDFKAEF